MKIYDESGVLLTQQPDLEKGYLTIEQRLAAHHPEQAEQSHIELMPGTEDLRRKVVDVPAREAWDEYEEVQVYHLYTPQQLEQLQKPTLEERLTAAENALLELMLGGAGNV